MGKSTYVPNKNLYKNYYLREQQVGSTTQHGYGLGGIISGMAKKHIIPLAVNKALRTGINALTKMIENINTSAQYDIALENLDPHKAFQKRSIEEMKKILKEATKKSAEIKRRNKKN